MYIPACESRTVAKAIGRKRKASEHPRAHTSQSVTVLRTSSFSLSMFQSSVKRMSTCALADLGTCGGNPPIVGKR